MRCRTQWHVVHLLFYAMSAVDIVSSTQHCLTRNMQLLRKTSKWKTWEKSRLWRDISSRLLLFLLWVFGVKTLLRWDGKHHYCNYSGNYLTVSVWFVWWINTLQDILKYLDPFLTPLLYPFWSLTWSFTLAFGLAWALTALGSDAHSFSCLYLQRDPSSQKNMFFPNLNH